MLPVNEFSEEMAKRQNFELIEIVNSQPNDYLPEAISAAEFELRDRNLSDELYHNAEQELQHRQAVVLNKAQAPLQNTWKWVIFLMPGFATMMISGTLKADGYDRRYKEALRWSLYGIIFYVTLGILALVIFAWIEV